MKKEKLILTDIDGVCLNWNEAFYNYMSENGYEQVPGTESKYNLAVRFGKDPDLITHMLREWNNSIAITNLEPLADAQEGIKKLADAGFRFIAITSISDNPQVKDYRKENLMKLFGDVFDDVICLPTGSSKQYELEKWAGSELFWIEDHFKNAEAGYEVGLNTILVDTEYNRHYQTDLFPRVSETQPWKEIVDIVFEHYGIEH